MSITLKHLSKLSARTKELEGVIREHLQIIDDKLLHSDKTWGRNIVTHDLPTSFIYPGLDKKDAQRMIYSSIIKNLQKRGFEVKILLETERTIIYISWTCEYDTTELDTMNTIIRDNRILASDIDLFINGPKKN